MSDEPKKRPKRGRPSKNPEKKPKIRSDSISNVPETEPKKESKFQTRMLDTYNTLLKSFLKDGVSQQHQYLLRKLAQNPEIPVQAKSEPLLQYLNMISQELLMNELEIVVLGIYLEKFGWSESSLSTELLIRYSAYGAKDYLAEDMNPINSYICSKYPGFIEDFYQWKAKYTACLMVNPKDLNDKFRELNKITTVPGESKIIDYNYYVDEILEHDPNIVYDEQHFEDILNDPDCMDLINAIKEKKKIVNNDNQELSKNVIEKIEKLVPDIVQENKEENKGEIQENFIVSSVLLSRIESLNSDIEEADND